MLNPSLVIARKEFTDHLRDHRSVLSALLYSLMGPVVVFFVSFALPKGGPAESPLPGLMSVFALVAAFTGGTGVAMDTLAGERERRSLLPLLMNPISRSDVTIGKWLTVAGFSVAGLLLNLAGFAVTWAVVQMPAPANLQYLLLVTVAGLLPLTLLSAAVELFISTNCRTVKETQTYLSLAIFVPMFLGMGIVFYPHAIPDWLRFVPVAGQQLQLMSSIKGGSAHFLQPFILGWVTIAAAIVTVFSAAKRLQQDDVVFGD